jgi:hypothetical protein
LPQDRKAGPLISELTRELPRLISLTDLVVGSQMEEVGDTRSAIIRNCSLDQDTIRRYFDERLEIFPHKILNVHRPVRARAYAHLLNSAIHDIIDADVVPTIYSNDRSRVNILVTELTLMLIIMLATIQSTTH